MKRLLLSGVAVLALPAAAMANCPAATVADMMGVANGAYPQQFDLDEFQASAGCTMEFAENPAIADLNGRIRGNPALPPLAERLPAEPLVMAPYTEIGKYGGTLDVLSNATESGTSDFLSVRHATIARYSDDLQTVVPNVAKGWEWNADFTELTIYLRAGHKWSDGAPFTAEDIKFWYDNLMMDTNVIAEPKDYALAGGEPMEVVVVDPQTVKFMLKAPKPGLLESFTSSYVQPFQPKHFLGRFHPAIDANADANAKAAGFENGYEVIKAYWGNSDWTDTPSPLLTAVDKLANLPADVVPTLESHITVAETAEGRHFVANPYFFQVDTAGNQLPYISEMDETYVGDAEVRNLKLLNGEVDYKSQAISLDSAPILLEGEEGGNYTLDIKPTIAMQTIAFNVTSEDEAKRAIFGDIRFRTAMSVAINRDELNEVVYLGLGEPRQYIGFSPRPEGVDEKWLSHEIGYEPDRAMALLDEMGLVDVDGDGMRDLPNGDKLVLDFQFSTQAVSAQFAELVAQNWADVGVEAAVKEVTSDEYRSAQSANKLDVTSWWKGMPAGAVLGDNKLWVPPFDGYFDNRTGMLWAEWISSNGANGVEPPQWVKDLSADIEAYQGAVPGSPEAAEIAGRMVEKMTGNLLFIGTVLAPSPIYHKNTLKNFPEFKTASYEYYRTYPYRPTQWWLDE